MPSRLVVDRCKVTIEERDLLDAIKDALKKHCWDTALPPQLLASIIVDFVKDRATLERSYKEIDVPAQQSQNGPYR